MFKPGTKLINIKVQFELYDAERIDIIPNNVLYTCNSLHYKNPFEWPDVVLLLEEFPGILFDVSAFRLATPEEIAYYEYPNKLENIIND